MKYKSLVLSNIFEKKQHICYRLDISYTPELTFDRVNYIFDYYDQCNSATS